MLPARVGLAAFYELDGAHDKVPAEVAEMLSVRPEELAQYPENLREAGLPE